MNTQGKLGFIFMYLYLFLSRLGDFIRVNEYERETEIIFQVSLFVPITSWWLHSCQWIRGENWVSFTYIFVCSYHVLVTSFMSMNTMGNWFLIMYLCLFLSSLGDFICVNEYEGETGILFIYLCLFLSRLGDFIRVNEYEGATGILFHVSLFSHYVMDFIRVNEYEWKLGFLHVFLFVPITPW